MKKIYIAAALILTFCMAVFAITKTDPWKENELMEPAELAKMINNQAKKSVFIYSIGPSGLIKRRCGYWFYRR